ncbi:MAG: hypothetical protein LRY35_01480 [Clostridiales bacterium]|nr:hypothetical protein [Clostridiales bacterium]
MALISESGGRRDEPAATGKSTGYGGDLQSAAEILHSSDHRDGRQCPLQCGRPHLHRQCAWSGLVWPGWDHDRLSDHDFLLSIGILFGVGGATLFAIRLGEGKGAAADEVLGNMFTILCLSGVSFMVLGQIFLNPLLRLFGASETILPYATSYMRVIFFGALFQVLNIGMNNFLRADGQPRLAMITMFVGARDQHPA